MKRGMKDTLAAILLAAMCVGWMTVRLTANAAANAADEDKSWGELQFLKGTWGAAIDGKTESSSYTFAPELKGHVLVRRCATGCDNGPMGAGYSDVLYIYQVAPGQPYRAIFFDTEGHVLQYAIATPAPNKAVFLSDEAPGPRFQLTYQLVDGTMQGKFEMLPPGGGAARQLSAWSGTKK